MSKFLKKLSVDQFNAKYPVGSRFAYYPFKKDADCWFRVETRTEAAALGHGDTVVMVTNVSGCVDITHLKPVE
jgi:hypothetical protein